MNTKTCTPVASVALAFVFVGCHQHTMARYPGEPDLRLGSTVNTPHLDLGVRAASSKASQVRITARHVGREVELDRAIVRTVRGSQCSLANEPECGPDGQCRVKVDIHGKICVLYVRAVPNAGEAFPPQCHDLSHPELSDPPQHGHAEHHPVWDACVREMHRDIEDERMLWSSVEAGALPSSWGAGISTSIRASELAGVLRPKPSASEQGPV